MNPRSRFRAVENCAKSVSQFRHEAFDLVVTVCDEANEDCPVWLGRGVQKHRSFRDPAKANGTEEEHLAAFRQIRDEIEAALPGLLA